MQGQQPRGGGGLSSSAGLDDEWSGVPDIFSSSELPSTDLPLPFSGAASGLWLLELEFSLFSLQEQEQSSGVSRKQGRSAQCRREPEPPRAGLQVFSASTIFSSRSGLRFS